jgi:hypothetical protein
VESSSTVGIETVSDIIDDLDKGLAAPPEETTI